MFSSENLLGIPQTVFGLSGVRVGNLISQEIEKQGKGFKPEYNSFTKKITIFNTSDLPPSVLNKILYESPKATEYSGWYPVVNEERSKEGNLEIRLSQIRPGIECLATKISRSNSISGHNSLRCELEKCLGQLSKISMFPDLSPEPEEDILDSELVASMEKSISEGVINAIDQFLNNQEKTGGIWYPNDYREYLINELNMEMDESFYTGFASEKFFEKTGRFTFKLKNGEKASEALLSFLEGPTVADCGNATMACYYKCVLDIVGKDKFDELFSSEPFLLTISQHGITDSKSPISYLADYTKSSKMRTTGIVGKRPLEIGQECHFAGIIWYANKHPQGFGGGWNVIYIGNNDEGSQLFMAHGFDKPLTENEINQKLVSLYNRERTPQDDQYAFQAKKPELYDRETNRYLISNYIISAREVEETPNKFIKGFLVGSARGLQVNKLIRLKNAESVDQFILTLMKKNDLSFSESLLV